MIIKEENNTQVYSDGDLTEKEMLKIAQKYPEDTSEEFICQSSKYTINNTFSSVRKNIINWYPFKENSKILEIGAGMGSITGLLCDKAESVTALEMSNSRADVIRARYPKRKNLTIITENINTWNSKETFDYIVFIGVLEYAEVFLDSQYPFEDFMNNVKKYLKKNGTILFAIENRFGLKYWLGASEDHLQKPYVGLKGYEEKKTPKTFSKIELENLLKKVGLKHYRFYNVLPDYKFPEIICTDEFVPNYMNLKKISFTYSKNSSLVMDEKNLYKDIIENNKLDFFANSYLVEAKIEALDEPHIVYISSKGEVEKKYRVSTIIDSNKNIKKVPMHIDAIEHINNIYKNEENLRQRGIKLVNTEKNKNCICSEYHEGISAQDYFQNLLKENNLYGIQNLIHCLRKNLLLSSNISKPYENILNELDDISKDKSIYSGIILEYGYIDMTFYNAFWENEDLIFYDQEWCFKNIPLDFILYYAIKSSYTRMDIDTSISLEEILKLEKLDEKKKIFDQLESYIWSKILYRQTDFYGEDGYCNRYGSNNLLTDRFQELNLALLEKDKNIGELNSALLEKDKNIEELNSVLLEKNRNIEEYKIDLRFKDDSIVGYKKKEIEYLRLLDEKIDNIQEQKNDILNREAHIQQLLQVERDLQNQIKYIEDSYAYQIMKFMWKVNAWLFPINSKRRFLISVLLKYRKHPLKLIQKISISRLKNMFIYLDEEDINSVMERVEQTLLIEENKREVAYENISEIKSIEECQEIVFEVVDNPQVSIIIPVYNQFSFTYYCLKAIKENTKKISYEIIMGDDCSYDLTVGIRQKVKNIKVIRNEKNLRFLKNCNNAAKHAKGKYILFLNNDTQVQDNWLEPLVDLIERDNSIGMVGSKLIYSNGKLQEAGGIIWNDGSAWNYGNGQDPTKAEFNYVKEVDYISGAAIMIKKSLWENIGGFDETFAPAYCEDSDLAFQVRKMGYKVMYQPLSEVVHFEGVSNGTDTSTGQKKYQIINQEHLLEKWKSEIKLSHLINGENVFIARDKSKDKPTILMIDHYVPQYDKDAGSRTVFQYLKLFVKKGFNVKFIGDNFYQHEPYTTVLQQMGIEVLYGKYYSDNWKKWIKNNGTYIQYVFLNRPHISEKYIDFIRENTNAKIIYYGHDLHFLREERKYLLTRDEKALIDSKDWKKKELELMNKADIVYYPSYVEVNEIKKLDQNIEAKAIIPYIFEYEPYDLHGYRAEERKDIMFVGGFAHMPNIDAVKWFHSEIFPKIKEKNSEIKVYIVGSNPPKEIKNLNSEDFIVKGYVSDIELEKLYKNIRMVVVPLRYGAGIKGKVVESMRYSVPFVTTSIGIEGISDPENIFSVNDNPNEFAEMVTTLYKDLIKLDQISKIEKKYIQTIYSYENAWNIIKKDFELEENI